MHESINNEPSALYIDYSFCFSGSNIIHPVRLNRRYFKWFFVGPFFGDHTSINSKAVLNHLGPFIRFEWCKKIIMCVCGFLSFSPINFPRFFGFAELCSCLVGKLRDNDTKTNSLIHGFVR